MTRRLAFALLALLGAVLLTAAPAGAGSDPYRPPISVADLLADPGAHSGQSIAVRGELVGDFGERRDGTVWTQLNGDAYADAPLLAGGGFAGANLGIGVRFPREVWPGFEDPGGYRQRGPVVEVTGVWRFHDPDRGGETYLDATGVVLVAAPLALEEGVRWLPVGLGLGFLGAAGAVTLAARRRRAV